MTDQLAHGDPFGGRRRKADSSVWSPPTTRPPTWCADPGGERIMRGAFKRSIDHDRGAKKKLPLFDNHKNHYVMGEAVSWDDTDEGLIGTFAVYEGKKGDELPRRPPPRVHAGTVGRVPSRRPETGGGRCPGDPGGETGGSVRGGDPRLRRRRHLGGSSRPTGTRGSAGAVPQPAGGEPGTDPSTLVRWTVADIDETLKKAGWFEVGTGAGMWRAPDAAEARRAGSTRPPTPPSRRFAARQRSRRRNRRTHRAKKSE